MKQIILTAIDVTKNVENCGIITPIINCVSLEIGKGDFVLISGPSGCGKSSLLSILGLLSDFSSGQYYLDSVDISRTRVDHRAAIRNKIGFIFQSFNLLDEMSVFDNIALPLRYSNECCSKLEIEKRVMSLLELLRLSSKKHSKPSELSGGQQQLVAIARALSNNPRLILADEPTGNLDSISSEIVLNTLAELNRNGATICMVSHDHMHAIYANKHLLMNDGKIIS